MSAIRSPQRAVQVAAIVGGLVLIGLALVTAPLDRITHRPGTGALWADELSNVLAVVPTAAVGALLAVRRPRNPIGWLILAILLIQASPTSEYSVLYYRMHQGIPLLGALAVILQQAWPFFLVFIAILLWIFPDGKLPAGRWRRPSAIAIVTGLLCALAATAPGAVAVARGAVHISLGGDLTNPQAIVFGVLEGIVIVGCLVSWLAWLVLQIPTYRHAGGERRQQLKWLYSGAAILVITLIIGVFVVPLTRGEAPGWGTQPVVNDVSTILTASLPVCLGVAVLKYRLYDLDRIISRVVSYALITALLGGVYVGLILLATRVLSVKGAVSVAVVTLVTAALFNPLRRRVQRMVDRRFSRSRYDAEAVVAEFSGRLRYTVDLDAVRQDLVGVVSEAFQPSAVSIWLTPGPGPDRHPPGGRERHAAVVTGDTDVRA